MKEFRRSVISWALAIVLAFGLLPGSITFAAAADGDLWLG